MGKRSRKGGVTGQLLRSAARAAVMTDETANVIAQRVYGVAVDLQRDQTPSPLPLSMEAPFLAAAELMAQAVCRASDIPGTEANLRDIAAYLTTVFVTAGRELDGERLEQWRSGLGAARFAPDGGDGYGGDGAEHGGPA